jgi:hypothetical protein
MTIRMDEGEVIAAMIGSGIFTLAVIVTIGWLIYLMVRPSRRRRRERERQPAELTQSEAEQMLRLIERMDQRLEVLERVVARDGEAEERILETGEAPELRRIK